MAVIDNFSHKADALDYMQRKFEKDKPPVTATEVAIRQKMFDRIMAEKSAELRRQTDKTLMDALNNNTGTTNVVAGITTWTQPQPPPSPPKPRVGAHPYFAINGFHAETVLAQRLRLSVSVSAGMHYFFSPLDYVHIVFDDTKAFITVIAKGKATVLEDDAKNFPTDELVAQFRLLLASQ